ncbi:MAG: quinone oxidoreductase, partial [Candidatus Obscuribacterales bacterium]|nr:quinone oxidoreductase [Steroidobacteraceae bacterium]
MTHAIRIHSYGGPEVLTWESVNVGEPGPDQVRLRHTAIGLNFIDVYERTGLYPGALPGGLGREAAGVVEAVGPNVHHLKVGDRIAYTLNVAGSYAEQRVAPADRLIKVPDSIADDAAAAIMLKGLTAQALLRRTYRVQPGDTVLVHAAAGGVGLLLVQWAKHLSARVIGIVGNESKAKLAREHGADLVLLDTSDWVTATREYTNKLGVAAVYDSV